MHHKSAALEIFRWGYTHVPGSIFYYARELDLDMEDIGIISAIFYTFEAKSKPLFKIGVNAGQVLQCCPSLTKTKLARKLSKLEKADIISVTEGNSKNFADKVIFLEPLMERLEEFIIRDHPDFYDYTSKEDIDEQINTYQQKIEQLELELEQEKSRNIAVNKPSGNNSANSTGNKNYKRLADFIASKTGNLLSVKMAHELKHWLDDLAFTPEFLYCLLEMCFERNIVNPRLITKIAEEVKECAINSVEGLEIYFNNYVNADKLEHIKDFDPEIIEFGNFTGIDMSAEARRSIYYKWRYDWAFSHTMIMKAGQIMCQRTRNGGLEYIDSVLKSWMSKEIRSVEEADKEIAAHKSRVKKEKNAPTNSGKKKTTDSSSDYKIYVPPLTPDDTKKTV